MMIKSDVGKILIKIADIVCKLSIHFCHYNNEGKLRNKHFEFIIN